MDQGVIEQFRDSFLDEVAVRAEAGEEFVRDAFVQVFVEYLSDNGILSDFEKISYKRAGQNFVKNVEIDGYANNQFEEAYYLILADYTQRKEISMLTKTEAIQKFNLLKAFVAETYAGKLKQEIDVSHPARELCNEFLLNKSNIRKFKLFLLSDRIMSKTAREMPTNETIEGIPVEYHIWSIDRLANSIQSEGEVVSINLKEDYDCETIPCVKIFSGGLTSYLCSVPGVLLANLYDKLDTALLEGNIRSFLSTKVAVNSGIKRTIVNEPAKFFVYNNGISAVASCVETTVVNGIESITSITDLQIVNGGQTTASLSNARFKDRADLSQISVAMKLTVVEKDYAKELIPKIAEFANTQNKVNPADFFSNHDFCVKMERFSRTCKVPAATGAQYETLWFFERAKGQYVQAQMRKTATAIKSFKLKNPKERLFTKTDLAKYVQSWKQLPHVVSKGAQTNFQSFAETIKKDYEKKADDYNESYYKEVIALGILFKATERIVSAQDWYQQGYRAQIVTYSLALFSYLLEQQYSNYVLDFGRLWNEQKIPFIDGVPDCIQKELKNITTIVNDIINADDRGVINVTQWCKQKKCWDSVKERCNYRLSDNILNYCLTKQEKKHAKQSAKKEQKFADGVNAEVEVFNYGAENWKRLMTFTLERKLATEAQMAALKVAVKIPNVFPNSRQAKLVWDLLESALDNGFKK